jgi:very-short-patch-repair endonuclease
VNRKLRKLGFTVVRIWEHDIEKRTSRLATILQRLADES